MSDLNFFADYSKRLSKCKKCKKEIEKGALRLGKLVPNAFGDADTDMKQFYHVDCLFDSFKRVRAATKIIESADDIQDFDKINKEDQELIVEAIKNSPKSNKLSKSTVAKKIIPKSSDADSSTDIEESDSDENNKKRKIVEEDKKAKKIKIDPNSEDNKFETFQTICDRIGEESGHLKKSSVLRDFLKNGILEGNKILKI